MVRAKFRVDEVRRIQTTVPRASEGGKTEWAPGEIRTIVMSPISARGPQDENFKFWTASPSGKLELGCANLAAAEFFELGKEYFIDFSEAK